MMRRLFNLFSILSLLMFLVAIFFSFRSYSYIDSFVYATDNRQFELQTVAGEFAFAISTPTQSGWQFDSSELWPSDMPEPFWPTPEFLIVSVPGYWGINIPILAFGLLGSGLPIIWMLHREWVKRRRAQRVTRGLCMACSYNLQGVTGPVCPECGVEHRQPTTS